MSDLILPVRAHKNALILLGFSVALLGTGIGIGGGAVFVPAFISFFDFDYKRAAGLSLATIIPIALTGAIFHLLILSDPPPLRVFACFIPMCMVGAVIGSTRLHKWNNHWLKWLFTMFLLVAGFRILKIADFPFLLFSSLGDMHWAHESIFIMAFGLSIGWIASCLGVGCGLLIVPFFVIVMDFTMHQAICLSLTTIFFLASSSTLMHHHLAKLDIASFKILFVPSFAGALTGSAISGFLPGPLLNRMFGVILLVISGTYLYQMIRPAFDPLFLKNASSKEK